MTEYQKYLQQQFFEKDRTKLNIQEDIFKFAKESWNDKLGYVPQKPMALITVTNPKSEIIQSIGASEPSDIILDNFGVVFAGQYNNGGTVNRIIPDRDNFSRTLRVGHTAGQGYAAMTFGGQPVGMQFWIGRGGGGVARTDFTLFDPYVVLPEAEPFNMTAAGGWINANEQVIAQAVLNNVTTSDTIGECGLIARWTYDPFNVTGQFLITHDIAGGAFTSGQNVNVTYTWSIS